MSLATSPILGKVYSGGGYGWQISSPESAIRTKGEIVDEILRLPPANEGFETKYWSNRHFRLVQDSAPGTAIALPDRISEARPDELRTFEAVSRVHLDYLMTVSSRANPPLISTEIARLSRIAWWLIWKASGQTLPIPAACTGSTGEMFYSWDKNDHHLELEIIPKQPAEFFYCNRKTEELWSEDWRVGDRLSDDAVKRIQILI